MVPDDMLHDSADDPTEGANSDRFALIDVRRFYIARYWYSEGIDLAFADVPIPAIQQRALRYAQGSLENMGIADIEHIKWLLEKRREFFMTILD